MSGLPAKLLTLALVLSCLRAAHATGYYGPELYLDHGGANLISPPEFYWDLEVKRMARDFHPTERPMVVVRGGSDDPLDNQAPLREATADADIKDFADALKSGEIKPPDPAQATHQHANARAAVAVQPDATNVTPLPPEFDSEFADYHRGAYAYRLGKDHWAEAQAAWEALLKRPAPERHYRSVWAAFMLGKLAMKRGDLDGADWFRKTRELAKQGFADSLGMAADSYGWEGRTEWKLGHPEKAAPLFLNQLALGDVSAVVSLKALIPDRAPIDGMLNYDPEREDSPATPDINKEAQTLAALDGAAKDPLLRRLVTAHILATGTAGPSWSAQSTLASTERSARWLTVLGAAKLGAVEDAEYLGWVAYSTGDYAAAQRWLDLAKGDSPAAEWLRAKLQLRAGHLSSALKDLGKAFDTVRDSALYTGWNPGAFKDRDGFEYDNSDYGPNWMMGNSASGDLGQLHLAHGDFLQAMDILLKGKLWEDAAFVAERILTANEVRTYVDKLSVPPSGIIPATPPKIHYPNESPAEVSASVRPLDVARLRYLLGRRLVREHRFSEAMAYLPGPYQIVLKKYTQALKDGDSKKLPRLDRAHALFTAAWLARYDGMELMGTEGAPDSFIFGGDFESPDLTGEILSGTYSQPEFEGARFTKVTRKVPPLAPTRELHRLKRNAITPNARWHYRYLAADLAMQAAGLLNDNTEQLADVVNTAGLWMKDLKEEKGDAYYQVIERRCPKTQLGAAVITKHWFVNQQGPWSTQEQADDDSLQNQYGNPRRNREEY